MRRFAEIVDHAMRNPELSGLRPVVEKELLHYDILFALEREGLLRDLTFQGGTSLRLCHGAPRFSEDLDFVGGTGFAPAQLREIRACVEAHIGARYSLDIHVKEPAQMRVDPTYFGVAIDRWQVAVVTNPGRSDLPRQKIKLEVANVPAYTSELRSPMRNYQMLPAGYEDILIPTETLEEVMADKIVALVACTSYPRHRDIWDLRWLRQNGARVNADLVAKKVEDYRVAGYQAGLEDRIANIEEIVNGKAFIDEMSRFVTPSARQRTFDRPGFTAYLGREVRQVLSEAREALYGTRPEPEFVM
ncbi:nucleotidyl transferase AbiEii/AbiGii toxin family protein [Defluviimonas salinarum]|uniref:Nucleotidyl transferase AbiEii/AbiGii toxin family protein n=1 Tax=Defluviimonas salinarum TaxID=2992147 RepID=A0ABT3J7C4_9RHOB|nr:nucleotidyl transferase AbiEii/AbiGii toxin family protein [Defluviimonas salinarum]MCW3783578.1 nucleotidyl transferase AbiEii/AbiGii toxin family protein [Defluviimonas salinarum]